MPVRLIEGAAGGLDFAGPRGCWGGFYQLRGQEGGVGAAGGHGYFHHLRGHPDCFWDIEIY